MSMLSTLQWYILREMGKTFLLTAVALTAVLGLGGGALNLVGAEQVSPSQLLSLMLLVLPVAGTLTLPVAALYSATVVYGRMSADNEFLACRASGINIGKLFLPPAAISLLAAACTFYFTSFMIPGLVRDLNTFARTGLRQLVEQQIRSPERLPLPGGKGRIYADASAPLAGDEHTVVLYGIAYVEMGEHGWRRIGTAEKVVLRFDQEPRSTMPTISGELFNLTFFDLLEGRWGSVEHQAGRRTIPLRIRSKVKWLDLVELIRLRRTPEQWPDVASALEDLRDSIVLAHFYAECLEDFERDRHLVLTGRRGAVSMSAAPVEPDSAREGRLTFRDVTIHDRRAAPGRTVTADEAQLYVDRTEAGDLNAILVALGNVSIEEAGLDTPAIRKGREQFQNLVIPEDVVERAAVDSGALLREGIPAGPTLPITERLYREAVEAAGEFIREASSELHSRLAFSVSALVLVILGAALGVLFKGSQIMVAFGISFVPSIFLTVMNIMGRQLAEKAGTASLGIGVIWAAIVLVGALDIWALSRVIRR